MLHFRGGRAAISQRGLSGSRARSTTTSPQAYRRRAALARRRRLPLRADRRHQPRLPVRREDARGRARSAATIPNELPHRYARVHQRGRSRSSPPGMTVWRAPVPRQLQERVGRRGRLRAGRRGAVQRDGRRRATSSSTTTSAPATSRRCASCRKGKTRRARPGQHQARRAREQGRAQAAHRRGGEVRAARAAGAVAAVRLLEHRARQRHRRRRRRRRSCGWWSRRRRRSGAGCRVAFPRTAPSP